MKLDGIFAPLTTPFSVDGSVALDRLRENVGRYNQTPLRGYVINGSTSESVLLRWEEVYRVWETAKGAAASGKMLIAGSGAESTSETIEHTNRAASLGYEFALVRTPSFYKPAMSDLTLATHYLRVAEASRIPILLYSVPIFTNVTIKATLVASVAKHPNIIGIKDSSGDMAGISAIIAAAPKSFQALGGSSSTLYESLSAGAVGAILALANAFPEICVDIYEASRSGNSTRASELQKKLSGASEMFGARYGIAGLKYALGRLGYFGGPPRPPLLPVKETEQHEIDTMLASVAR
jgi:4-hydroxy-2-oxoglutarate aldolase